MSKTAPEWLDKDFFSRVIRHYTRDEEAILRNFSIRSGAKAGESFASDLFRVTINYAAVTSSSQPEESISVMVKTLPENEDGDIGAKRMFLNEMKMYGEILPDIKRVVQEAYGDLKLFPRFVMALDGFNSIIVERKLPASQTGCSRCSRSTSDIALNRN